MKIRKLAVIMLAVFLVLASIGAHAAKEIRVEESGTTQSAFVPRMTAPDKSNACYYSDGNPLFEAGYGMPNCTAYAWGRTAEITGEVPELCLGDADNWWQYNIENNCYPYGQSPKEGAVACWNYTTGGGHVAVVEEVEDGIVTYSNSAYGGEEFYLSYGEEGHKNGGVDDSTWVFQGYIYVTDEVEVSNDNVAYYETYIVRSYNGVNIRTGPGISHKKISAIPYGYKVKITQTEESGGYTWGRTSVRGKDCWCVLDFSDKLNDK